MRRDKDDGCDETKTEEEETVADSVAIHTTIKQITGRGVVDGDDYDDDYNDDEGSGSGHDNDYNDGQRRQRGWRIRWAGWPPDEEGKMTQQ